MNRVMKYAYDLRNYYYNGGASLQQYWDIENTNDASGLTSYGQVSYYDR